MWGNASEDERIYWKTGMNFCTSIVGKSWCWKAKTSSVLKLLESCCCQVEMNLTVQSLAGQLLAQLRFQWRSAGMGTFTSVDLACKAPTRHHTTGIFHVCRGCRAIKIECWLLKYSFGISVWHWVLIRPWMSDLPLQKMDILVCISGFTGAF